MGARMRGAGIVAAIVVAAAFGLDAGDLLAQARTPVVVTSMTARPDVAQLQSAAWEWITATITSTPFIVGIVLGVALAEAARFVLRWVMRGVGIAAISVRFVIHHRLLAAGLALCIYYVAAYHVMA